MTIDSETDGDRDGRLDLVVAEYLREVESGVTSDHRAWLVRHPEFFDELSDFFADRDELEQLAGPLRMIAATTDEALALQGLDPPAHPEHLGRLGPYEVTDWLGQGGMGVVLKAFDATLNRYVAIKLMAPQWSADAAARRRFSREAQAAAAVSHPHVVTIHAVGEWRGRAYLVMEYISGRSLEQRIRERGPLELKEVLWIGSQVASGLAAAHAQGLIHRDVKPANIMLENDLPRVKLTDFGLARAVDDVRLTQQGILAGTPQYMAPEQARGIRLDRRADLFSLGSVLYALCTGRPAFAGETTVEVIHRVCEETPVPMKSLDPNIPDWFVEIVDRLHAKEPSERFQHACDVAALLEQHLAQLQDPSLPPVVHDWVKPDDPTPKSALERIVRRRSIAVLFVTLLGAAAIYEASRFFAPPSPPAASVAFSLDGSGQGGSLFQGIPPGKNNAENSAGDAKDRAKLQEYVSHIPEPLDPENSRLIADFHQDFRGGEFDYRDLKLVGGDAEQLVQAEKDGLRIRIPAGLDSPAAVGIAPRFRVHGDFEITASVAIVKADKPVRGYGLAAALWVQTDSENEDAVTVERGILPKEGEKFTSTRISGALEARKYDVRRAPAESRFGRIRMARIGSLVVTSFAEGTQPFRLLRIVELGPEDLTLVRLGADTGVSNHPLDVRLEELTIRAEALPGFAGTPKAPARFPWAIAGARVIGLALLGGAVWWLAAARRSSKPVKPRPRSSEGLHAKDRRA